MEPFPQRSSHLQQVMNRSDPGPEGRVLTVAVALGVAIAGLGVRGPRAPAGFGRATDLGGAVEPDGSGRGWSSERTARVRMRLPHLHHGPGRNERSRCDGRLRQEPGRGWVRSGVEPRRREDSLHGVRPRRVVTGRRRELRRLRHERGRLGPPQPDQDPDDVARGASQGPPVWSPDGTMLAFEGDDGKTNGLYVMNADGTGFRWLAGGLRPEWSPDGSRILFTMGVSHGSDLYTIAPDGTDTTQLTNAPGWDDQPSWSPDGARIGFERTDGEVNSVFVMAADGSEEREVFQEKGVYPIQPLWSADGTQLLFEAYIETAEGQYDLYIVNVDGSGSTKLTPTTDRAENTPVWSPDGTMIAFRATTQLTVDTADYQVYSIRPDGTHEERLTIDQSGYSLAWQSAGWLGVRRDILIAEFKFGSGRMIQTLRSSDVVSAGSATALSHTSSRSDTLRGDLGLFRRHDVTRCCEGPSEF